MAHMQDPNKNWAAHLAARSSSATAIRFDAWRYGGYPFINITLAREPGRATEAGLKLMSFGRY